MSWRACVSVGEESECGQSTVEYALVLFAFLASILAMASLWHGARDGALLQRCKESLSHQLSAAGGIGSAQDVALY